MISKLHFISQEANDFTHLQCIEKACMAGVNWVQLRVKGKPYEEVLEIAKTAKMLCDGYGAKLIINDFPLVARLVNAYGVHLGKEDMAVADARKIVSNKIIIGGTANTIDDIIAHANNGADYIGLGPFRFTRTKANLSPVIGLDGYYNIMMQVKKLGIKLPIIAIGGIEEVDVAEIMKTGVYGVAVSSLIAFADEPAKEVRIVKEILQNEHVTTSR